MRQAPWYRLPWYRIQWLILALSAMLLTCLLFPELPSSVGTFSSRLMAELSDAGHSDSRTEMPSGTTLPLSRQGSLPLASNGNSNGILMHAEEDRGGRAMLDRATSLEELPRRTGVSGADRSVDSAALPADADAQTPSERDPRAPGVRASRKQASGMGASRLQSGAADRSGEIVEAVPIRYGGTSSDDPVTLSDERVRTGTAGALVQRGKVLLGELQANLLVLHRVEIEGLQRLSRDDVLRAAGLSPAPWVWELRVTQVEQRLAAMPWIEHASVAFHTYPAEAVIRIEEAQPWIIAEYEGHSWLVSQRGRLLQPLDAIRDAGTILESTELPRLVGLDGGSGAPGALSSANARFLHAIRTLHLLQGAGEFPFSVERFRLLPNGSMLLEQNATSDLPVVLLHIETPAEASTALERLRVVLKDARKRGERLRRIDLRFRNQAIVN